MRGATVALRCPCPSPRALRFEKTWVPACAGKSGENAYALRLLGSILKPGPMVELIEIFFT